MAPSARREYVSSRPRARSRLRTAYCPQQSPSRSPQLLQSGQADAVTSWEPEPQKAADALGADALEFQDRTLYREIVNLHTTAEFLEDPAKRRGIVAFVKALIAAADQFQNHPDKVWPLLDVLVEEDAWVGQQTGRAGRTREQLAQLIDPSVLQDAMAQP